MSFYLGSMLDNAGITDTTTQLEIVSSWLRSRIPTMTANTPSTEHHSQRLVSSYLSCRYMGYRQIRSKEDSCHQCWASDSLPFHRWCTYER